MVTYTQRRRRWHTRLVNLDEQFKIPEEVQIEMLLDGAGLTYDQRNMIITSAGADADFERICDILREQHANIHEKDGAPAGRRTVQKRWQARRQYPTQARSRWRSQPSSAHAFMVTPSSPRDAEETHEDTESD